MISVITCAHNPRADYLELVLRALSEQTLSKDEWEFLLVDSSSAEPLAGRVDLSWHPNSRTIREDVTGLTRARLRGIAESRGELLVFVDDDNVLGNDFLEQATRISREWPSIGAWSGCTRPGFDLPPPEWSKRYWGSLVLREVTVDLWSNLPLLPETMPCGAGLCVRREAADHYRRLHDDGRRPFLLDRVGTLLLSGGDNDLAACACDIGLGVGLSASLRLVHLIPPARLDEDYLVSLSEGIALSAILLRSLRSAPGTVRPPFFRRRVADALRFVLMTRREKRFFLATRRGEKAAFRMLAASALAARPQAKG